MDDIVRQAMAKWPQVPACFGWLGLDNRGHWHMRDDRVQQRGHFQSGLPGSKGSLLQHEKLIDFIHRNYQADAQGRWYFQNGPQKVFVELASTPLVWRLDEHFVPTSHTGERTQVLACLVDEMGHVYLHTKMGFGLVHSSDVGLVAEAVEQGIWTLETCQTLDLSKRFGFVISPQQG